VRRVLVSDPSQLTRHVPELGRTLGEELLEPTRIYAPAVRRLLGAGIDVHAMAHITGGGLVDNPPRCVPAELGFRLFLHRWEVPAVMQLIADRGGVEIAEMRRTFNMGLGLLVVVPEEQVDRALALLGDEEARVVGELLPREAGDPEVAFV